MQLRWCVRLVLGYALLNMRGLAPRYSASDTARESRRALDSNLATQKQQRRTLRRFNQRILRRIEPPRELIGKGDPQVP